MKNVDLNLLVSLDALLAERSVTAAARHLGLSVSAMSRTLSRLRQATGDQLLIQAGRALVPTPYAEELSKRVPALARDALAVLRPATPRLDMALLEQTFTLRAGEGFIDLLGAALVESSHQTAPHVRLCFMPKPDWDAEPLRAGLIDLEIGIIRTTAPEVRTRRLFHDRYVGVCRTGHPLLADQGLTPERYMACKHVVASRTGEFRDELDESLRRQGLKRSVVMVVPAYPNAMQIARHSDLIAVVPYSCLGNALAGDHAADMGLQRFELPVATPEFHISAIWHPRLDADPAQRWLRATVLAVCRRAYP
jgi:DNA-binding transcriptional LysR family regulator